jgi:hypothetical protein
MLTGVPLRRRLFADDKGRGIPRARLIYLPSPIRARGPPSRAGEGGEMIYPRSIFHSRSPPFSPTRAPSAPQRRA